MSGGRGPREPLIERGICTDHLACQTTRAGFAAWRFKCRLNSACDVLGRVSDTTVGLSSVARLRHGVDWVALGSVQHESEEDTVIDKAGNTSLAIP